MKLKQIKPRSRFASSDKRLLPIEESFVCILLRGRRRIRRPILLGSGPRCKKRDEVGSRNHVASAFFSVADLALAAGERGPCLTPHLHQTSLTPSAPSTALSYAQTALFWTFDVVTVSLSLIGDSVHCPLCAQHAPTPTRCPIRGPYACARGTQKRWPT